MNRKLFVQCLLHAWLCLLGVAIGALIPIQSAWAPIINQHLNAAEPQTEN